MAGVYSLYMSFHNIRHSGTVRSIIFQQNGEWFGAALEFNIVETGCSPQEVDMLLDEAIAGYIEAAQKNRLSSAVLNQTVEPEYEALWNSANSETEEERKKVYKASQYSVPALA